MANGRYFLDLDGGAFAVVLESLKRGRCLEGKVFGISQKRVIDLARTLDLEEFMIEKMFVSNSKTGEDQRSGLRENTYST